MGGGRGRGKGVSIGWTHSQSKRLPAANTGVQKGEKRAGIDS